MTLENNILTYSTKYLLLLILSLCGTQSMAQTYPSPNAVSCVDSLGNVVVAGGFDDEFILDGDTIEEADGETGIFVAKFTNNGSLDWVVLFTTEDNESDIEIGTDSLDQINITLKYENTSGSPVYNMTLIGLESDGDTRFVKKGSIPVGG